MTGAGPILLRSFAVFCVAAAAWFLLRPGALPGGWRRDAANPKAARFVAGVLAVTGALLGLAPEIIPRLPWRASALRIGVAGVVMLVATAIVIMIFGNGASASVDDGSVDPHNEAQ